MNAEWLWGALALVLVGLGWALGRNVAGYIALKTTRQFSPGDWLNLGGIHGQVIKIGWQAILIKNEEGREIYIPNTTLFNGPLERIPPVQKKSGVLLSVPLPEGCDPARGRQAVWEAAALSPYLGLDRPIEVTLVQRDDRSTWIRLVAGVADERFVGAFETAVLEGVREQIG